MRGLGCIGAQPGVYKYSGVRIMAAAYPVAVPELSYVERASAPLLPTGTIQPDAVPAAKPAPPIRLMRIIVPAVMILAMLGMVALLLTGEGQLNPMMLLFPLMMGASMLAMFMPQGGDDTDESRRVYLRHVSFLREQALEHAAAQRAHELHRHPDPKALFSAAGSIRMWERSTGAPDVCEVRLGLGTTALCTPIELASTPATEDLDPVCAVALRHTVTAVGSVPAMPITVQLASFPIVAFVGSAARDCARALLAQLVFHHGPELIGIEVSTAQGGTTSSPYTAEWEWLKWLPHCREPENAEKRILLVEADSDNHWAVMNPEAPWECVIALDPRPASELYQYAFDEGIVLRADQHLYACVVGEVEDIGVPDRLSVREATQLAKSLHPFRRPDRHGTTGSSDLTALLGYLDAEHLTAEALWAPRAPGDPTRLNVPIGVDTQGRPLYLDIKESAHGGMGPHGLCIGATGSGKSELLRTFVVSLALSHSPRELNFVLVDFKGGATFLGLDGLPHTSAVITNLQDEASLVERMHDAISGEMNRRQELLRRAGNYANVDDFNRAADEHREEPLPALVIILDEFSELLGQHPDFADLFAAVGRLGRSLHIHLLLASQRLEEGRLRGLDSHLSYRIGLKTFSAMESRQVLGVPDAYELPNQPGRGFLKSDSAQLTGFQTSYVSGSLTASHTPTPQTVTTLTEFHTAADTRPRLAPIPAQSNDDVKRTTGPTLVDRTVELTTIRARELGYAAHQIWLDPLPAALPIGGVVRPGAALTAPIGIIDRPFEQRQDPLLADFTGGNGHLVVCGGPQMGKTTMLRSIAVSLAATHSTADIRFYVLDVAGEGLRNLERLPHTAGVAVRGEDEKMQRIVDEVVGFIDTPEPYHTFVFVDGWQALNQDVDDLMLKLQRIASEGLDAHVHLLVSTSRWTAVRPAVRDLINQRYELRLPEPMDSLIDRKKQEKLPAAPGRGITPAGEGFLIAQSSAQDIAHVARTAEQEGQGAVPRLKVLPAQIAATELPPTTHPGVLLGIGGERLEPITVDWDDTQHVLAVGSRGCGKSQLLRIIGRGVCEQGREQARLLIIDHRRRHLGAFDESMLAGYSGTTDASHKLIADLCVTLRSRMPSAQISAEELVNRSWWDGPDLYLIVDDSELLPPSLLDPLAEFIPHATDIGLHIVLARKAGGINRALYQPALAELKDASPLIAVFDADKDEGPILGLVPRPLPPGRAQLSLRGQRIGLVQVVND